MAKANPIMYKGYMAKITIDAGVLRIERKNKVGNTMNITLTKTLSIILGFDDIFMHKS